MGRDKALLELAGKPLLEHALVKLRRFCSETAILTNNDALGRFGSVVNDLHPDCGPLSGIEAALAHATQDWSLIVPVDLPFPPTSFLRGFASRALAWGVRYGTRMSMFTVDGVPQPTLLMIHRDVAPYLTVALAEGRFKLFPALEDAAKDLEARRPMCSSYQARLEGLQPNPIIMKQFSWTGESKFSSSPSEPPGPSWTESTSAQEAATHLYFANLNTPEEFAAAEMHLDVLDS
jgi:molybdopterin-guanine dinucleotide biosynthesis protein A